MPEDYFNPRQRVGTRNPSTYVGTYPIASANSNSLLDFQTHQSSFIGRPVNRI